MSTSRTRKYRNKLIISPNGKRSKKIVFEACFTKESDTDNSDRNKCVFEALKRLGVFE